MITGLSAYPYPYYARYPIHAYPQYAMAYPQYGMPYSQPAWFNYPPGLLAYYSLFGRRGSDGLWVLVLVGVLIGVLLVGGLVYAVGVGAPISPSVPTTPSGPSLQSLQPVTIQLGSGTPSYQLGLTGATITVPVIINNPNPTAVSLGGSINVSCGSQSGVLGTMSSTTVPASGSVNTQITVTFSYAAALQLSQCLTSGQGFTIQGTETAPGYSPATITFSFTVPH